MAKNTLHDAILATARGDYQQALLAGYETWSGSTLRGKARNWSSRYASSRRALEERIRRVAAEAGAKVEWTGGTAKTGPRRLVVIHDGERLVYGA